LWHVDSLRAQSLRISWLETYGKVTKTVDLSTQVFSLFEEHILKRPTGFKIFMKSEEKKMILCITLTPHPSHWSAASAPHTS